MSDYPDYDEGLHCANPECIHKGAEPIVGLHGTIGGGGLGIYTVCGNCGEVLSKTLDAELCDSHEEDIGSKANVVIDEAELLSSFKANLKKAKELVASLKEQKDEPATDVSTGGQADNKPE